MPMSGMVIRRIREIMRRKFGYEGRLSRGSSVGDGGGVWGCL